VSRTRAAILLALLCAATVAPVAASPADSGDVANDAGLQWSLRQIHAEEAWETATGEGVVIAVVDSGIALGHEDLEGQLEEGVACRGTGGDPARCEGSPRDDDGHGSHVAGIAAAATGNGPGIAGVAPDARILPVKVLFRDCPTCPSTGTADDVAAGMRWAVDRGAQVVNVSLGSTTSSVFGPEFAEAVRYAWDAGVIPVVAAGNEFVLAADFGDAPAVVVSATDRDDGAPSYSRGVGDARWAVAAPGGEGGDTETSCSQDGSPVGVLSTYWAEGDDAAYACLSGTSMAAPHVAGALAVLLDAGLSPGDAIAVLLETATDLGPAGRDEIFGSGRIDLAAAVDRAGSPPSTTAPPTTAAAAPADPDDPLEETSSPQPFGEDGAADKPAAVVGLAVAAIVATAGAGAFLRRRDLV
jgi:subtilisin family serine protease